MDWPFGIMLCSSISGCIPCPEVYFDIKIAILVILWFVLGWYILSHTSFPMLLFLTYVCVYV